MQLPITLFYVAVLAIFALALSFKAGSFRGKTGISVPLRIAHAAGLKHDNMAHPGRLVGAAGTALLTLVTAGYGLSIAAGALFA